MLAQHDVSATAAAETVFTIAPKDRLGNPCDQAWSGFSFTLRAMDAAGTETPLPGSSIRVSNGDHELVVPSLQLGSGNYVLKGSVQGPGVALTDLAAENTLTIAPVTCGTGGTAAADGLSCVCQAGYYGSNGSCQQCEVGSYKSSAGDAVGCSLCLGGSTTSGTGSTTSSACQAPANSVEDESSGSFVCDEGYYGSASTGCSACGLNSFKGGAGDAVGCTPCPEGGTTTATASISAANCTCPATTQLDSDADKCLCLEGYYGSGGSCSACALGTYKGEVGNAMGCSECPEGGVTVSTGSTSADLCSCPAGSELNAEGTACLCSAGYFGSEGECQACAKGSYKAGVGNVVGCNPCPNGSTTGGTGSVSGDSCDAPPHSTVDPVSGNFVCQAGYFGSAASGCERCPSGTFKDVPGDMAACLDCMGVIGEGGTTLGTGADAESDCVCRSGFYQVEEGEGVLVCSACPEGATCDGGGVETIRLKPGFWRSSTSSLMLHECERPQGVDLCQGTDAPVAVDVDPSASPAWGCREGHHGFLCFECMEDYGKRLGLCEACGPSAGASGAAVFVGTLAGAVGVYFLVAKYLRSALGEPVPGGETGGSGAAGAEAAPLAGLGVRDPATLLALGAGVAGISAGQPKGGVATPTQTEARAGPGAPPQSLTVSIVKVVVTWLQLASLAAGVKVPWSPEVRELLEVESLGTISPFSFSSFNCVAQLDFYARFYLAATVPLLCVGVAGLVVGLRAAAGRMRARRRPGLTPAPAVPRFALDTFVMVVQMLWFLTYTMVTESVMSIFKCRALDADGLAVLSADVSVECGTPQHRAAVSLGLAMLLLHTVGVPLQAALQMRAFRGRLAEPGMRVRYAFYFQNYRPELYWYECFGMLRKAGLAAAVALLQDRAGLQVFTVAWVSLVYLTVHTHFKPYAVPALNELETGALFVSAATLTAGTFFFALPERPDAVARGFERGVSWTLVLLSLGFAQQRN